MTQQDLNCGKKLIVKSLLLIFTLSLALAVGVTSVRAAGSLSMSYSNGSLIYSGTGFAPNTEYTLRVINQNPQYLVAISVAASDASGNINPTSVSVGTPESNSFNVIVNDSATGTAIVSQALQVSTGGGSGSGGGGGSSNNGSSNNSSNSASNASSTVSTDNANDTNDASNDYTYSQPNYNVDNIDDGSFIGATESPPAITASDQSNTQSKPAVKASFGKVPQTDVIDIYSLIAVICVSIVVFAASLVYILRCKYNRREYDQTQKLHSEL